MTKQMIIAAAFAACSARSLRTLRRLPLRRLLPMLLKCSPPLKEGEVIATMPEAETARGQNEFR